MRRIIFAAACLLATTGLASASTIFTLYGTGFSNTGTALTGGSQDGNWTLESAPQPSNGCPGTCVSSVPTGVAPYVTDTGQFPFTGTPSWIADTANSKWVSPFANENSGKSDPDSSSIPYVYQTTFNLSGLDPTTATITGQWTADNYGYILLNGQEITTGTDGIIANAGGQFTKFFSFVLNSSNADFVSGINTLQFYVFNNANGSPDVTGANIDIQSDFADPTPEPAAFGFVGLGLVAVALIRRRSA